MHRVLSWFHFNHMRIGSALAFGTLIVAAGLCLAMENYDEKRRFASIVPGMSEDQVLAAMEVLPGNYGPPGAVYAGPQSET